MRIRLKQDLCTDNCSAGIGNCERPKFFKEGMEYEAKAMVSKPSGQWCSCLGGTPSDEGHQLAKEPGYIIEFKEVKFGNYWIPGKFAEDTRNIKETPISRVAKDVIRMSKKDFLDKLGDMM